MNLFIRTTGVTTDHKTLWRSSQQSPSSPHKGWEQHRIKLFQSSFFGMEMSFSCCIAVIFYFSSRPSACPACFALSHLSSERLLGLMIWTISPFITHIMSWWTLCTEYSWRYIYIYIYVQCLIKYSSQHRFRAEYRFQLCLSACPVSIVNDLWEDYGWRFL